MCVTLIHVSRRVCLGLHNSVAGEGMGVGRDGDGGGDDPGDGANGEGWEAISEIGMYGRQGNLCNLGEAISGMAFCEHFYM